MASEEPGTGLKDDGGVVAAGLGNTTVTVDIAPGSVTGGSTEIRDAVEGDGSSSGTGMGSAGSGAVPPGMEGDMHAGAPIMVPVVVGPDGLTNTAVVPGMPGPGGELTPPNPNASASLYVGDLHPEVNEHNLMEVFSAVGSVQSVRVCRDVITRRSLGYGYVNFFNVMDAERALDTMNYFSSQATKGRPLRLMWKHRDPSVRKIGQGNIFIKNLDKTIDNKSLFDTFSLFGNIMSCKVQTDESGNSLGYGFVHFETPEAAEMAMQKVNGMLLAGKKVYVGPFLSRKEREATGQVNKTFTNIYVKDMPDSVCSEEKLRELFEPFGTITSLYIPIETESDSKKGFAFINFADPDSASRAVDQMHDYEVEGRKLYVSRAMKKMEREMELKIKKMELAAKSQGVNLYVKNLSDEVDDDRLRQIFSPYGEISSAKIMRNDRGDSKGFGFVCFTQQEDATKAVIELNGRIIDNKPIYVALAQRKEERRMNLEHQRQQMRMAPGGIPVYGQPPGGWIPPQIPGIVMGRGVPTGYGMPPYMPPVGRGGMGGPIGRSGPMSPATMGMGRPYPPQAGMPPGMPFVNQGAPRSTPRQNRQRSVQPVPPTAGMPMPQARAGPGGAPPVGRGRPVMQGQQFKYPLNARVQAQPGGAMMQGGMPVVEGVEGEVGSEEGLTLEMLAHADEASQKQMLGERLYPLVHMKQPQISGKITGMLLELDNSEILHLLETPESLHEKVQEAVQVLRQHSEST
uniref:Polyadenylate-binding protein n=1 Tax=Compsopogon caeruleus TaxID=31354 RepID=A0A7S1TBF4_9RHOD|mmetsp:Transcript_16146/g.32685  ORF Transcript_16146/g.32685 Transcript_16146/m.32685 type:complete len:741 (+) Transcript_16146:309-2531(+)|eukprot:CAMPEP_0184684408 /NCGR_PEP_ID=MMETSP0312-20130426/15182_1 /TAXON_ID=31354 /ORGANISM="Compsopogon coeruleus, Strain SAG 36.94" /LENGTH=740 /DNA_ID=CAMNT_0027137551 /DNA_START=270 /DNA_END=2492 /DNA_ORIENTATION=+